VYQRSLGLPTLLSLARILHRSQRAARTCVETRRLQPFQKIMTTVNIAEDKHAESATIKMDSYGNRCLKLSRALSGEKNSQRERGREFSSKTFHFIGILFFNTSICQPAEQGICFRSFDGMTRECLAKTLPVKLDQALSFGPLRRPLRIAKA